MQYHTNFQILTDTYSLILLNVCFIQIAVFRVLTSHNVRKAEKPGWRAVFLSDPEKGNSGSWFIIFSLSQLVLAQTGLWPLSPYCGFDWLHSLLQ